MRRWRCKLLAPKFAVAWYYAVENRTSNLERVTCAVLHFSGGVHKFTTMTFTSVIAGVICRVKEHGW